MNTFQAMLKKQIVRFGLWLSIIISILFMIVIFIYSILLNSHRARNYNEMLASEFKNVYQSYSQYVSPGGADSIHLKNCLNGKISGVALSFLYGSFSRQNKVSSHMILTDSTGAVVSTTYRDLTMLQRSFNQKVLQQALQQDGIYNTVYYFDGAPRYVFAQKLMDGDVFLGAVCLYLNTQELVSQMNLLQYGGIIVHGDSNVIVAFDNALLRTLNHFYGLPNGRFVSNGHTYWMHSSKLPEYNATVYTYVGVTPIMGYYSIYWIFAIALLLSSRAFYTKFAQRIAKHSAASVEHFHREIDAVTSRIVTGGANRWLRMKTGDEFEDIARHINVMLESMSELSERNMELLRLNNVMEIRKLEAQFNPHFLYNTLESIRFAIQMNIEGTSDIILKLTRLLRYSIDSSKNEVTLAEDLHNIMHYLEIIQFRFGGRLTYTMDIDTDCGECLIPKLLLQPIVENSMKYGFESKEAIHVSIQAKMTEDYLLLTVRDDGVGITESRLAEVRALVAAEAGQPEPQNHYELHNVARRLKLQYGAESRLEIDSLYGEGATVRLWIRERRRADAISDSGGGG